MALDPRLYVTPDLTKKTLHCTLKNGTVVDQDVYIREVPAGVMHRYSSALYTGSAAEKVEAMGILLSAAVCDSKGEPHMTAPEASMLNDVVAAALVKLTREVNPMGEAKTA